MVAPGREPFIIALAGPNGAGKSTFYELFLEAVPVPFVNADRIARSLAIRGAASIDYEAAKIAQSERRRLAAERQSFITETVFSDPAGEKVDFLVAAKRRGYFVCLVYIGLESAALSAARVAQRVRAGGHEVPSGKLPSRYKRSLKNLRAAVRLLDHVRLYDNSSAEGYRLLAVIEQGALLVRAERLPAWAKAAVARAKKPSDKAVRSRQTAR